MAEVVVNRAWRYRAIFAALAFAVVFVKLLPLNAGPGRLPGPDILVCLSFAWVLRRPAYVPVWLIAAAILITDIAFLRPLGLWTAFVVVGSEYLRGREHFSRDIPLLVEWLVVSVVIVAMTIGYVLVLAVFAVDQPPIGLTLIQMIATILAYPLAVAFSAGLLGLRRMPPGAVDELGRKL